MRDEDDYITVNITCNQAAALAAILNALEKTGVYYALPSEFQAALDSFVETMSREISNQKGV